MTSRQKASSVRLQAGPEVGDLGASPAPKTTMKAAKHNLPLGGKPCASVSQPIFALAPGASGVSTNVSVNVASGSNAFVQPTHVVEEVCHANQ